MKTLPYALYGDKNHEKIIVFLHGWPDNLSLWKDYVDHYSKNNFVVCLSYPNFDQRVKEPWGRNFEALVGGIKETLKEIEGNRKYKRLFVVHDWGSILGFLFDKKYPGYINDMIVLDVSYTLDRSVSAILMVLYYQWCLAISFLTGINFLTMIFVKRLKQQNYVPDNLKEINPSFNYLYYYLWRKVFFAMFLLLISYLLFGFYPFLVLLVLISIYFKFSPPLLDFRGYKSNTPIVFIYGTDKKFNFHKKSWADRLKAQPNCDVIPVSGGHWVMKNHKEKLMQVMDDRLNKL